MKQHPPSIKAILFDFDGTLTVPGALDFPIIKQALGCPVDQPILEYIKSITDPRQQQLALDRLDQFETQAARNSIPNTDAIDLLSWIKQHHMAAGILTRNSENSVLTALGNFNGFSPKDFDVLITRDDPVAPKPSAEGVIFAARAFGIDADELIMVGDYIFDCQAGKGAGALTVLLDPDNDPRLQSAPCDYRIKRLSELKEIILGINSW